MNTTTTRPSASGLGRTDRDYANQYTSGALLNVILNHIATTPNQKDARYKLPQLFQAPRVTRFGFRLLF
jgi:hypothetical protein